MNYRAIVCFLMIFFSSFVFSINVHIESSHYKEYPYFEYEPSECEILAYLKKNIKNFFPNMSKLDRGLKIIRLMDNFFYVRLSADNNNYHFNEDGMYICKNCCKTNPLDSKGFHYHFMTPSEFHIYCNRCEKYFMHEDDHSTHLIKCAPGLLDKLLH